MRNFHLIKSILSEPWLIDEQQLDLLTPLVDTLFTPNMEFEASEGPVPEARTVSGTSNHRQVGVKVIPVQGALTKYDQSCGPVGMTTIGRWVQEANAEMGVDAIVLRIDSPGGSVSGTEDLANIIKSSSKPVVAFVDDMACSAAYWIASSCQKIVANLNTAIVGSIGVISTFADAQPMWEAKGVKFHKITAPQSTAKTRMMDQVRAGDYKAYKEEVLAPLAERFIETVTGNRAGVTREQCTGDVFFAQDVIGSFVDSIGTIDDAIRLAASLVEGNSQNNQAVHTKQLYMKKSRLATVAGVEAFESADGTITLTQEQAQEVENALAAAETDRTNLETQQTAHTEAQQTIEQLQARVAELEANAGATTATAIEDEEAGAADDGFWGRLHSCREMLNPK